MSTRSTTHFKYGADEDSTAIIYRHSDGYPAGHGRFLKDFLDDIAQNLRDTRFSDPSYLAAKLVVALGHLFNVTYKFDGDVATQVRNGHPLDFLSVGVVSQDPGDIEYRYDVICGSSPFKDGRPLILVYERTGSWDKLEFNLLGPLDEVLKARV